MEEISKFAIAGLSVLPTLFLVLPYLLLGSHTGLLDAIFFWVPRAPGHRDIEVMSDKAFGRPSGLGCGHGR